jgi:hypothetical protein
MPYTATQYARFALTGKPDSEEPDDDTLAMPIDLATTDLIGLYPCVADDSGTVILVDAELVAWNKLVGATAAEYFRETPGNANAGGNVTEVKIGPVSEKIKEAEYDPSINISRLMQQGKAGIACIREAIVASNNQGSGLPDLVGRRRTFGEPRNLQGYILNGGRCRP